MNNRILKSHTAGARWDIATEKRFFKKHPKYLEPYGFKVYSQNDEDGIIEEIFHRIGTTEKRFVEFGVENGLECNGHYLLFRGWRGLWLEGNPDFIKEIECKFRPVILAGQLEVEQAFITRENINGLIAKHGLSGEIDLLSIDIDGNDYHVWKVIDCVNPRVVVIEYNAKLPPTCQWVMPYNARHIWDESDRQGASLLSLEKLGREKGYQLVGTNINGINAFFVRQDLAKRLFPLPATAENLYNPMRLPEVTFYSGHPAKNCLVSDIEGPEGDWIYEDWSDGFLPVSGFYPKEWNEDGTFARAWMSEETATLVLYAKTGGEYTLNLELLWMAPVETSFTISIPDADISWKKIITKDNFSAKETMRLEMGYHRVALTCEKSFVPAQLWDTTDRRTLYIGLKEMKLVGENDLEIKK